jgi:AAHS family 4-hydroxybenzoate transporter-like MFS transporter
VTSSSALDIRQFIDDRPVGRYQLLVATMCGLIVFVDGFDAQAMGFVAPALTAALKISRGVLGSVISSGLVGMMIGALVSGPLADRIGRKPVLVACALIFGVGSLLTATAQSVEWLMAFRAFTGLGMGGAMPNAIALTSEYMPRRRRAGAVTMMICGFSLGAAVGGLVAASIIPRFGWPAVFIVGGVIPIVIGVVCVFVLPESIRFLVVRGGGEPEARQLLSRIAPGAAVTGPLSPGHDEHALSQRDSAHAPGSFIVAELFTNGRAMATTLIWVIYFMNLLNLYFLNSWLPTIISDAGIPVETAIRLTSLFQIGGIGGAIVLGRLLDRTFSFWILAACYSWAAAFVYSIGHAGVLALTITCAGVGIIGGQNASHALSSEFYPTRIRSTGVGWALGIGRIGSIVGPLVGGLLLAQNTPMRDVFWAAVIPAGIATLAAAAIALGTRSPTQTRV